MNKDFSTVKEYLGIVIDYSRDNDITEQGLALLTAKGFYKKDYETSPQEGLARASTCFSFGDYEFAQRIYDYASKGYFTYAGAPLTNSVDVVWPTFEEDQFEEAAEWLEDNVTPEGMPINCFLSMAEDTKEGLVNTRSETAWLSMMGGGIGIHLSNRSPDSKSTGVMAHLKGYDADALSYKQTEAKRGSIAAYLDIDHPEIVSFLQMRNPVGGSQDKKCLNLNNAINITDKFMAKVILGEKYELVDPKHGSTGRMLDAREVFETILELRKETGQPYIMFKDTVNRNKPEWITHPLYNVSMSNLCVAPETKILTDRGQITISDLEGQDVNVWNGEEFTSTKVYKTATNVNLLKVVTNSGQELECTPEHKFYVVSQDARGKKTGVVEKRAFELVEGDKLIKFNLPLIEGDKELEDAYSNGFYTGDGCLSGNTKLIYLYGDKKKLKHKFKDVVSSWSELVESDRITGRTRKLEDKFFVPDNSYTIKSRLDWLEGYFDADGTVARNGETQSLQVGCVNKSFLKKVQLMLQTLGVKSKVSFTRGEGMYSLPANNGTGENKLFNCKEINRLLITQEGVKTLLGLGFNPSRLILTDHTPNRECSQFIKISSVEDLGRISDTFCFTESSRGMGMFNGILTGQCSEIVLRTTEKRTAVCCLSSLNLEKFDEWKDTNIVQDLIRLLDNILEYFIRLAPPSLSRAVYSARKERAVGLGTLGWHSYLQSKSIPFESGGYGSATQENYKIYSIIKDRAVEESLRLGTIRGECDDCHGSGMRNSHLLAIAPNATSSSRVGTSPSVEPWASNAFNAQGRSGSFLIKNKYLQDVLESYGKNTKEVWKSIITNEGSVQHLNFLSDHEKRVFKTFVEIDPMWIIEHASIRQPKICQSQSINIKVPSDITLQEMVDIHMTAWKKELKTLYYCRSEPAGRARLYQTEDETECLSCEG